MRTRSAAWILGLAALAACTGIQVDSQFAPGASLEGYRTYAWLDHPAEAGYLRAQSRFMEQRIITAVDSALASKGYAEVGEPASADFLVAYQVTGTEGLQAGMTYDAFDYRTPQGQLLYPVGPAVPYVKGTLIIDVVSTDRELLWRGSASGSLEVPDQGEVARAVHRSAARIIGRLPKAS
ncbi:MAG: DUF4136 domain-containing protein [Gemmatimonadota bacterium]|nr:MAG: DUF4136 domain-containing protein [Gemmatimonadota bacterium]